ncbi:MAG: phosphoenolpyruvate carboxylase [Saprospiraceae bacterium]
MDQSELKKFDRFVGTKYHLFNSLFLRLPFDLIHQTGILLPLLTEACQKAYHEGGDPKAIIEAFFEEFVPDSDQNDRLTLLFNFIKYIERQVVLFDATEDAAFDQLHDLNGSGTVSDMISKVKSNGLSEKLMQKLADYRLRIVLTAHPTQFYPGPVLGIMTDLSKAIKGNDIFEVNDLLHQLGKTPFVNRTKPTPLDEARSLIWYLRQVFYEAIPEIVAKIEKQIQKAIPHKDIIDLGFWPGGDRDGNPNVSSDITKETARQLRNAVLTCYEKDLQKLRRRLTFQHVYEQVSTVGGKVHRTLTRTSDPAASEIYNLSSELLSDLKAIRKVLAEQHDNLFAEELDLFITKVDIFGFHFACLDIRQDSGKHEVMIEEIIEKKSGQGALELYQSASIAEKMQYLAECNWTIDANLSSDPISKDIINSLSAIREIQASNGEKACHRYVISHSRHALDVFTVQVLAKWIYGHEPDALDIVPLFESIDDLAIAGDVMHELYNFEPYKKHLIARQQTQTVMVGFSDGTKDGGYVKANWSIYTGKEELTRVSRSNGIKVIFFDGRGGPPARGGGNTHKFYSSLGSTIENKEVQLTIQGQTISSNFGSKDQAIYNLEQFLTAGLENDLYPHQTSDWTLKQRSLMKEMADTAYEFYIELKTHPDFLAYLQENGTLPYYGESNIGSRPDKRAGGILTLDTLRAIPFVGTWSQLKQNVPGYYGFGAALEDRFNVGREEEVRKLYTESGFFQTLVGNSMQALAKSYFPLTAFLSKDPRFGEIWNMIHDEYSRSQKLLLQSTGVDELMSDSPSILESINLREEIVLPLLTIQQYALLQLNEIKEHEDDQLMADLYRKLITRTMPGIINAARNSA